MGFRRLPNNYGTITKLKGNRRKPFRAMKRIGERYDDEKQTAYPVYATVGYYETREEAMRSLALHNGDFRKNDMTLNECYDLWRAEFEQDKELPKTYITAWEKYLVPLHNRRIGDLRTIDLERIVNADTVPKRPKVCCAIVLHGIFKYAFRHEIIAKDYAHIAKFTYDNSVEKERKVFTADEIERLWADPSPWAEMTIVLLYTGMRISELSDMKRSNVHIDERYMVGGVKTEAGRNRIIPIHSAIVPIVERWYAKGGTLLFTNDGKKITTSAFTYWFSRLIDGHTPHDTRHTFITQAYLCGIAEPEIKRIVGHTLNGITQSTYIHLDHQHLVSEIEKLHY